MKHHPRLLTLPTPAEALREIARLGVQSPADRWMVAKAEVLPIRVEDLDGRAASLLKQELLAAGGECAVHPQVAAFDRAPHPVLLLGTRRQYRRVLGKLALQPFGLPALAEELRRVLAAAEDAPCPPLKLPRGELRIGERTLVMGILNVTEGSFSGDGLADDLTAVVAQGERFAAEGAHLLDVGGESTRPGAPEVPEAEELRRVVPAIRALRQAVDLPLSVDTRRAAVARAAVEAGADMVNDVYGLREPGMLEAVAELGVPVCIMHMQGTPPTMQQAPHYGDLMTEIYAFLAQRLEAAVEAGIAEEQVLVDPGLGFGKTAQHNLEILRRLRELRSLGRPVLVGPSRKATLGKVLDQPDPQQRQWGTAAAVALAIAHGADMVRVHDVAEMAQVARMTDAVVRGWAAPG